MYAQGCHLRFGHSRAGCPPIEFATLIHMLIERTPSEHPGEAVRAADIDERLGGQPLAIRPGQHGVDQNAVVRAALALQLIEPRQRSVAHGIDLASHRLAIRLRHDDWKAGSDHLVARYRDGFAQELGAFQQRVVRFPALESAVDEYSMGHRSTIYP